MNPVPALVSVFTNSWIWSVVGILAAMLGAFVNDALGRELNRCQLDRALRERRWASLYRHLLAGALDRVDSWLTPDIAPSSEAATEGRRAWSWPLFDVSLRLAVIYPAAALVCASALFGGESRVGNLVVNSTVAGLPRTLAVAGLFCAGACLISALVASLRAKTLGTVFSAVLASVFAAISAIIVVGPITGTGIVLFTLVFALTYRLAAVSTLMFCIGIFIIAMIASGFASLSAFRGADIAAAVGAAAIISTSLTVRIAQRTQYGAIGYCILIIFFFLILAFGQYAANGLDVKARILYSILAILPITNAIFDFLSVGLTRWLLRRSVQRGAAGALVLAATDLAGASATFVLLGMTIVAILNWLNGLGTVPLVDLAGLFTDIRADPGAYWWLYVSFFSTLLPTLLHVILTCFAGLVALMPGWLAEDIRAQLPQIEQDAVAKWRAFLALTSIGILAIAFVLFFFHGLWLFIAAVPDLGHHIGYTYLWLFEIWAAWLGADVLPVPPEWLAIR